MAPSEQITIERDHATACGSPITARRTRGEKPVRPHHAQERAARNTLRAQVARLERELSGMVADAFPHIPTTLAAGSPTAAGPRLLTLEELERTRDRLVMRVGEVRERAALRAEFERQSRELLAQIKLEPGHYKFVRLPVRDLGQGGCGAWQVRPRLGLIGMLAGWWHVKLSSGCPLPRGPRICAAPVQAHRLSAISRRLPSEMSWRMGAGSVAAAWRS
jgi:hypothetical protein